MDSANLKRTKINTSKKDSVFDVTSKIEKDRKEINEKVSKIKIEVKEINTKN